MSKKVFFIHLRNRPKGAPVSNRGGATIAYRETDDGRIEYAIARCMPSDNFSRKEGRVKSGGRINSPHLRKVTKPMSEQEFRSSAYAVVAAEIAQYDSTDSSFTLGAVMDRLAQYERT